MSDETEEDKEKSTRGWIGIAVGGVLVAVVTGVASFTTAVFSEDVARCNAATNFFIGFTSNTLYTDEERGHLIALYLRMAEENCLGE